MTEMRNMPEINPVHRSGFCISLVASPLATSAVALLPPYGLKLLTDSNEAGDWMGMMFFFFVLAIVPYLVIGTPMLLWHLRRHTPEMVRIAVLALVSLLWLTPIAGLISIVAADLTAFYVLPLFISFGIVVATLWGGTFAFFYKRFIRQ